MEELARRRLRGSTIRSAPAALAALALAAACGPAPRPRAPSEAELRSMTEAHALELVAEVLDERGTAHESGWAIDIGYDAPLGIDLHLTGTPFGIEWVSAQDRERVGDRIPSPAPGGQLRVLPGADENADASVLILDAGTYRYDPDRERVERGAAGVREVESRLRRDVVDFLEYVRAQSTS
jgi:hypothetical protein